MKNFNEMSKGEKIYAMNEVIAALYYEDVYDLYWNKMFINGELFVMEDETLEEAKEDFDECSDEVLNNFIKVFKNIVESYGCQEHRSIHKDDIDGLYVPYFKNSGYIEDARGGGFCLEFSKKDEFETMARVARVRDTLTAFGYPLTENEFTDIEAIFKHTVEFYVDWKKWRAQKAAAFIKESIKSLLQQNCGCHTIRLSAATQLAVGWKSGFNPANPFIIHSTYDLTKGLCAGIKAIEGNGQTTDFDQLTIPYVADGANKGETFLDLETPLAPEEDREKDFEHLIGKYQKLLKKYKIHADGKCFHKESW